jgi:hypothetical protein
MPEPPKGAAGRSFFVNLETAPNGLRPARTVSGSRCYPHPFGVRNIRRIGHDPGAVAPGYVLSPPSGVRIAPDVNRMIFTVLLPPLRGFERRRTSSISYRFPRVRRARASHPEPPKGAAVSSSGREPGDPRCRVPPPEPPKGAGGGSFIVDFGAEPNGSCPT